MHLCPCGEPTEDADKYCARCAALQTLDLQSSATRQDIEDAYRKLAKLWQPDPFQRDEKLKKAADAKLNAINTAYTALTSAPAEIDLEGQDAQPASAETTSMPEPTGASGGGWQHLIGALPRPSSLMAIAALVAGLCVGGFLLETFDSYLMGKPVVGEQYLHLKTFLSVRFREKTHDAWNASWNRLLPRESHAVTPAAPLPDVEAQKARLERTPHVQHTYDSSAVQPEHVKAKPYITAGLTKDEVIAIQGTPSSSSEDGLAYGSTEFYFRDGKLAGWSIDSKSDPVRVKLWPETAVDPNLRSFTLGSTKDQVLVIQGTPTLFSEDRFGYGGSEVYFQNDRVIGWKADPSSVPLRATTH
jgi:hypothetical protein